MQGRVMTCERHASERDVKGFAMNHSRHASADAIEMFSRNRARGSEPRSRPVMDRLTAMSRAIAIGARACLHRFLAALHESRRRQAAIERARYRHLIFDPETGISFGNNAPGQKAPPAD
jgi:hypothetical protein